MPTKPCGCTSRDGNPKKVFPSRRQAVNAALGRGLLVSRKVRTYPCPKLRGKWHVTTR